MPSRIEDYAVIGNCETLALVGRDGSIDWLCLPRFDGGACFSALLGEPRHGRWLIAPEASDVRISRRYRGDTLILETVFRDRTWSRERHRFHVPAGWRGGPGSHRPRTRGRGRNADGARGALRLRIRRSMGLETGGWADLVHRGSRPAPARYRGSDARRRFSHAERFPDRAGQEATFALTWSPSFHRGAGTLPAAQTLEQVESFWSGWAARSNPCEHRGDAVLRSLLTLKALTHWETGGIVAAGTTSLPEKIGGSRNWDYRYCWLRDATFTLLALIGAGFFEEAKAWHQWLLRAVAGSPDDVQTMYGVAGERRLDEYEIAWLPGYEGAARCASATLLSGNSSSTSTAKCSTPSMSPAVRVSPPSDATWDLECALVSHLETIWREPDEGIWEVRGGPATSRIRR